jgi:DNA-binding HxlR family transcriptional regulator
VFHQVPPRVEYSVTPEGAELDHALAPLAEWGKKHQDRTEGARAGAMREEPRKRENVSTPRGMAL